MIPGDGDIIEGLASIDESAITGESAPVIRESGGDRCAVTGGTKVLSDRIVVSITAEPGSTFIDRMIALVEGTDRRKTPNEIALNILLASLTIVFLIAVAALSPLANYSEAPQSLIVMSALLVCPIPTTIGALLSAIGIAGMDRLVQKNVLALSGRAVEAAGTSDATSRQDWNDHPGNRQAHELVPAPGIEILDWRMRLNLRAFADTTPEGRSVVVLCKEQFGLRAQEVSEFHDAEWIGFTAQTRMSGVDHDGQMIRKVPRVLCLPGFANKVARSVPEVEQQVDAIAASGGTPLAVANGPRVLE